MTGQLSNFLLFIFQCLLAGAMTIAINSFGSIKRGYVTLDNLLSTSNLGYNLLYRIVSPSIFISISSLILYWLGLPEFVRNIWFVSVYYFLFNFLLLVLLNRFELINKFIYFFISVSSVAVVYLIYSSTLKYGMSAILPEPGGFKTELWFIIFAYFYSLLNDFTPNYSAENRRKNIFLSKRFKLLSSKYDQQLKPEVIKNALLRLLFYSIMMTEDINRPAFIRLLERFFFFTKQIKTTGIMQVTSDRLLSDSESVVLAQKIILNSYKRHASSSVNEYELVNKIAADYNSAGYGLEIAQHYSNLKEMKI